MIHRNFKKKGPNTGGILPDIVIDFDLATSKSAMLQRTTMIYSPSKKTANTEGKEIKDEQLNRAVEILKARKVLGALNIDEIKAQDAKEEKAKEA